MQNIEAKQQLAGKLAEVLADLNVLATVSHGFHWNVKGPDFKEYHAFFGDIYDTTQDAIDPIAENIQKLGFDAPYLMQDFLSLTSISVGRVRSSDPQTMLEQLAEMNGQLIVCLNDAFKVATDVDAQAIANFLAGQLDIQEKWQWQIAASLGLSVNDLSQASYPMPEAEELPIPVEAPVEAPGYEDIAAGEFSTKEN